MGQDKHDTSRIRNVVYTLGRLPKGSQYIARLSHALRRSLTAQVASRRALTPSDEALIQSCVRHERAALLATRWMRGEGLTPDQLLAFSREVTRATDARDKLLERLGLVTTARTAPATDEWDDLYSKRFGPEPTAPVEPHGAIDGLDNMPVTPENGTS